MVRAGMRLAPARGASVRGRYVWGLVLALVAAGCGGGGGGGASKGVVGGAPGNSGHVGGATDPVPDDPTSGSPTSGDPTPGNPNGGDPNSGGSASGGGQGGAPSTGSGSGTGPTGTPLALRPDAIYFGHGLDASLISSVRPDGADRRDEGGYGANVVAATPDVSRTGGFVYAARGGGAIGLYRGASFDPAASTALAAPGFDDVTSLGVASDGTVAMVASQAGRSRLFLVADGTARLIDGASGAAISPDGAKIAYSKPENGLDVLCVWDRASGAVTRLVIGADALFPAFSRDGGWIVFSSNRDGEMADAPWDLYQVPAAGGAVERLTQTPDVNELGASYNADRSATAYVAVALDPNANGVYVLSNAGARRVAADADLTFGTYWTDLAGRSARVRGARFQRLRLPRP